MIRSAALATILFGSVFAFGGAISAQTTTAPAASGKPIGADVLFWSPAKREAAFPHMETLYPVHGVKRGEHVHPLRTGKPLTFSPTLNGKSTTLDAYMADQRTAGILVVQDGKIRLEKYALGYGPEGRWTSFSVAKSMTSTLVGAAIKDGYIKSIEDPVTQYIPGLKGSAYEGVSIRQLLTMTSGVRWNEEYTDPKSDVAQLFTVAPDPGVDATVSYMRRLPRESAPGTRWVYKTGETNLIGVLVTSATHKTLADYLSEKVWKPYGMEQDAVWMVDARGQEPGGCCISVSLHDYARFGEFIRGGGRAGGKDVLPKGWIEAATHNRVDTGKEGYGFGYGYQWWTESSGAVDALGIFGQAIHIDPKRHLIVAVSSAEANAVGADQERARAALFTAIDKALDAEH